MAVLRQKLVFLLLSLDALAAAWMPMLWQRAAVYAISPL